MLMARSQHATIAFLFIDFTAQVGVRGEELPDAMHGHAAAVLRESFNTKWRDWSTARK